MSGQSIARVLALDEAHRRARGLEVDELLGVDHREALGAEPRAEEGERGRRGLAGVVPALEGAHQSGRAEPVRTAIPAQRLHCMTTVANAGAARPPRTPSSEAWPRPSSARCGAGDEVAGVYACTRKDRLTARTGTPYLALELRDRTSALPARVFRDADLLGGRFDRGDLVRVQGRVERFRDELQVEVRAIERAADADPAAFLPVAYRNLDELDGFLEHLAREVHEPGYRALLEELLADAELRAAWRRAPCTRAGHHAYLGGLLEHTVAVATLALEACQLHPRLNSDLLICRGARPRPRQDARVHLRRGDRAVRRGPAARPRRARPAAARAALAGLAPERRVALLHCVLCHHGPDAAPGRRFGSPEALALYRLNALDATVKGALEHGLP